MPRATGKRCAQGRPRRNVIDEDNVGAYHVWVRWFHGAVGRVEAMAQHAARTGRRWIQGERRCQDAFT